MLPYLKDFEDSTRKMLRSDKHFPQLHIY
jgi:hypothetical protein